jgi:putative FmdB family regulatory protein
VPLYEYRCRTCETAFEARRSMAESNDPAACPDGHINSVRLLSAFASTGGGTSKGASTPAPAMPSGGGCGGCACH